MQSLQKKLSYVGKKEMEFYNFWGKMCVASVSADMTSSLISIEGTAKIPAGASKLQLIIWGANV